MAQASCRRSDRNGLFWRKVTTRPIGRVRAQIVETKERSLPFGSRLFRIKFLTHLERHRRLNHAAEDVLLRRNRQPPTGDGPFQTGKTRAARLRAAREVATANSVKDCNQEQQARFVCFCDRSDDRVERTGFWVYASECPIAVRRAGVASELRRSVRR